MNQYLKYTLTVAVTAAAMVVYQYEGKPEQAGLAQQAPTQVPIQVAEIKNDIAQVEQSLNATKEPSTKRELTQAELADIDPTSIDWDAMKARYKDVTFGVDPMLASQSILITDFSPEEIAAYNKLHVVAFNPAIGKDCGPKRLVSSEEFALAYGVPHEYVTDFCTMKYERPKHPYTDLTVAELRELVDLNNDAEAAVFASRHSTNAQEQIGFAIQAAALSGKSGPILKASLYVNNFGMSEDSSIEEVMGDIATVLIMKKMAALMGDPRVSQDDKDYYLLVRRGLSQEEIQSYKDDLNEIARKNLKALGEMQRDLTGATGILELTNA